MGVCGHECFTAGSDHVLPGKRLSRRVPQTLNPPHAGSTLLLPTQFARLEVSCRELRRAHCPKGAHGVFHLCSPLKTSCVVLVTAETEQLEFDVGASLAWD
jgi:hypothetical protein